MARKCADREANLQGICLVGHLALIRGNESHIGDYNLIFFVFFLWYELWSLLVSRGRAKVKGIKSKS